MAWLCCLFISSLFVLYRLFIFLLCSHHAIDHSLFFLYEGFLSSFFLLAVGPLSRKDGGCRPPSAHHVEGLAFMRTTTPVLGLHLVAVCDDATAALVNPTAWSRIEVSHAIPGDHLLCRRLCQHSVWDGPTARLQRGILTQDVMDETASQWKAREARRNKERTKSTRPKQRKNERYKKNKKSAKKHIKA